MASDGPPNLPAADAASALPPAPANDLPAERLRLRPDEAGRLAVTPAQAGWRYLTFETTSLAAGERMAPARSDQETLVVIVAGGGLDLEQGGGRPGPATERLAGRISPFADLPSAVYLPPGTEAGLIGRPAAGSSAVGLAIGRAPVAGASRRPALIGDRAPGPIVIRPADVAVEIRGAGQATRQVNHIVRPDFPARRLLAVEVVTPAGNWSSWPPHKHDVDAMPDEAVLEEIYHYRFRDRRAWGIQRLYRRPGSPVGGPRDALWAVRDGEVVIVTDGYHPFVAAPGHDAWYLNILAGDRRTMACSDDPDQAGARQTWVSLAPDPRLPLVPARRPEGRP
ncbi:MAG: 5-deoxy-glucuronate isomerase [Chloroflexota bacterium]|nr:MAG: 5-deoxy-glucuronate isomerase [Chloroflexota bacterium]